ncbi:MAG: sialidase family protein [Vicinamibacterales bacterium]|nr:sialidase family protein [Vicinamibacterales bacterium]
MMTDPQSPPVLVLSPRTIPLWYLPARRIEVGDPGDYKPSLAGLPNGELVMSADYRKYPDGRPDIHAAFWRSSDGGFTWSKREISPVVVGAECCLSSTSDGTLYATTAESDNSVNNDTGTTHSRLHRSTDGGRTWSIMPIELTDEEWGDIDRRDPTHWAGCSRNVLELADGTHLLGVCVYNTKVAYMWRSNDRGVTWQRSAPVTIPDYRGKPYDNYDGFFIEDYTFATSSGKLLHWIRVGPPSPMHPMQDGRPVPHGHDNIDRTMVCESTDQGMTWTNLRDFGDYGKIYPRVMRLRDGRMMVTYTQRALGAALGLRAVISHDDGETWDFEHDQIIIDSKTPPGMWSGGGFGSTVELEGGTMVSCYSYRDREDVLHVEAVRWRFPVSDESPFFFDRSLLELKKPDALEVLHDWSNGSTVKVDPCDMHLRGKGKVHATVKAQTTKVNGETFAARIDLLSAADAGTAVTAVTFSDMGRTDFSAYAALAIRAHNPTDQAEQITLGVFGLGMGSYHSPKLSIEPGATETVYVSFEEMQPRIAARQIDAFTLLTIRAPRTQTILVGPLTLIRAGA